MRRCTMTHHTALARHNYTHPLAAAADRARHMMMTQHLSHRTAAAVSQCHTLTGLPVVPTARGPAAHSLRPRQSLKTRRSGWRMAAGSLPGSTSCWLDRCRTRPLHSQYVSVLDPFLWIMEWKDVSHLPRTNPRHLHMN